MSQRDIPATEKQLAYLKLFGKIFARHSARNNSQLISETSGMMPNFAGVEKFFAHMTFKAFGAGGYSCRKQSSTREILKAKLPEPGGGSRWNQTFPQKIRQLMITLAERRKTAR